MRAGEDVDAGFRAICKGFNLIGEAMPLIFVYAAATW
jgi:hypothetical protein